ncbi:MAG: HNH endonuclease [Chloroflexi bacterium]|nr:HNH endonuclease [Chloroflexota bacterium]
MPSSRITGELRRRVFESARFRCGYCQTSQLVIGPLLELDHIIPEGRGGASEENNLWVACPLCNSRKSDRIEGLDPESGAMVRFYNPRVDVWSENFEWIESGAIINGKTDIGRATVYALEMNHPNIVSARQLWIIAGWHPPKDE